jgi:hypothetical protein
MPKWSSKQRSTKAELMLLKGRSKSSTGRLTGRLRLQRRGPLKLLKRLSALQKKPNKRKLMQKWIASVERVHLPKCVKLQLPRYHKTQKTMSKLCSSKASRTKKNWLYSREGQLPLSRIRTLTSMPAGTLFITRGHRNMILLTLLRLSLVLILSGGAPPCTSIKENDFI